MIEVEPPKVHKIGAPVEGHPGLYWRAMLSIDPTLKDAMERLLSSAKEQGFTHYAQVGRKSGLLSIFAY